MFFGRSLYHFFAKHSWKRISCLLQWSLRTWICRGSDNFWRLRIYQCIIVIVRFINCCLYFLFWFSIQFIFCIVIILILATSIFHWLLLGFIAEFYVSPFILLSFLFSNLFDVYLKASDCSFIINFVLFSARINVIGRSSLLDLILLLLLFSCYLSHLVRLELFMLSGRFAACSRATTNGKVFCKRLNWFGWQVLIKFVQIAVPVFLYWWSRPDGVFISSVTLWMTQRNCHISFLHKIRLNINLLNALISIYFHLFVFVSAHFVPLRLWAFAVASG